MATQSFISYDGVSLNVDFVKSLTRREFIGHRMHENHWPKLSPDDKLKMLNAAYDIITGRSRSKKS
jgi:hypothetical protein